MASPPSMPVPVADLDEPTAVRTREDGRRELVGSHCEVCGAEAFPVRERCWRCFSDRLRFAGLGAEGTLYSYTVVHVSSSRETPYALGYVDLPGGLRVLADLVGDHEALRCDQSVQLVADADGWSFVPTGAVNPKEIS